MESRICVRKITEKKDLDLNLMTEWMYGWWGKTEGYRYDAVYACMLHSLQETFLPQTYGLFFNDRLIGMCQFTMEDLFVRSEIYPWLANVYIEKDYRGSGLGRFLLNSVKGSAEAAGLEELYLFTVHNGFTRNSAGLLFRKSIPSLNRGSSAVTALRPLRHQPPQKHFPGKCNTSYLVLEHLDVRCSTEYTDGIPAGSRLLR